jgi:hypothetical protein
VSKPHILRPRNPAIRTGLTVLGILIIILSPIIGAIPGPGGIFVFAAGLALVLQNAHWAKRAYARVKRRWPRFGHYADMGLRRASAARRRARDRERLHDLAQGQP